LIDPLEEELITPSEATRYYPRSAKGKKVHVSKIYRDLQVGHRGVKLESIRTPRLATSKEAIARFFQRLSMVPGQDVNMISAKKRPTGDERIERELDRLGI
jgi:hypothetical protein